VRMCNVAQTVSTELASELTRWASKWRVARGRYDSCKILIGKPEGKVPLVKQAEMGV
jgi:hypothetical protein